MEYCVKINDFEGPLDLLLHLVHESDIDIKDINICEITSQYLDYIRSWQELNIDVASEYLVMASTLMEIKSKSLLPTEQKREDEEEEDSREVLIYKLTEYQKYKEITKKFKLLELDRKNIHTKSPYRLNEMMNKKFVNDTDLTIDDLMLAFTKFLERKDQEKPVQTKVTNKEYSVKKRKDDIKAYLQKKERAFFGELFHEYNKSFIVVTFMSILELAKEEEILLKQEGNFEAIMIELRVKGC